MRIGVSGYVAHNSGIGVVQRQLYPRLEAMGHELTFSPGRDLGRSATGRVRGLLNGFRPSKGELDVYFSVVPPLPFHLRGLPTVSVVHDLRWLRTRGFLGKMYREWDLRRTTRNSAEVLCISHRTLADVERLIQNPRARLSVAPLGPGMLGDRRQFQDGQSGVVLLVGGAPHKRNLEAARALIRVRPSWVKKVVGVGVDEETARTLDGLRSAAAVEILTKVDDEEMLRLYRDAELFISLSVEEGFGLPYVEALASGTQVLAVRQPLTVELMEGAAQLIEDTESALDAAIGSRPAASPEIRRQVAASYDWSLFATSVDIALRQAIK